MKQALLPGLRRKARRLGAAKRFERMNRALDRLMGEALEACPMLRREYDSIRADLIQAWERGRRETLARRDKRRRA